MTSNPYQNYSRRVAEAVAYYDLCDRASKLGIPVSLDDPRSPKTVPALLAAVRAAENGEPWPLRKTG